MALSSQAIVGFGVAAVLLVAHYFIAYFNSPLKKVPGPFLAKFTNGWRFWSHYTRTHIETQKKLHKKYGDAVRIGPNVVSVSDPELLKVIYSTRGTFLKSEYYSINDALQDGRRIQNIFGTRSSEFHARAVKPVQKLYSLNKAVELTPLMDMTLRSFCSELEQRFMAGDNKGKTCDIADWISYFAWDFLGDMTFSKRIGFMEQGYDIGGMLATAENVMRYFSVIGQIPVLDNLLGKNPYCPIKFPDFSVAANFCVARFMERMQNLDQYKDKDDFMNWFLTAKQDYPDTVSDNEVIGYLILTILGGADTGAVVQKAIIYHILKTPSAHQKLVRELRSSNHAFPASYHIAEKLPYLTACIKEGMRIHPVLGHILERVVPSSGLTLADDTVLPPGTIVGINPWVLHFNEEVFGPETDKFIPERWLQNNGESDEEYEARTKRMKDCDMSFGNGNRVCMGRPLALMELYKVTATLFQRYDIRLENQEKEWHVNKQWFVWPSDIKVKMDLAKE